ncbi:MAG: carbohydrate ABC transporter permease [Firmicutes bacterium]|nr:carbohydrate ABC transporter permease [Bacillota bacterium]
MAEGAVKTGNVDNDGKVRAATRVKDRTWLLKHAILLVGILFMIFPFLWMLATSFKQGAEVYGINLIPREPTWANFTNLLKDTDYLRWYLNSTVVAMVVTASELFFDSMAGYALAKLRFPGRSIILMVILSTLMIPTEMLIIPWYMMFTKAGWIDTLWGVMLPGLISAFGVFLMTQFMSGIPGDLLDAARIDGLNEFGVWWHVALRLVKPALAALAILVFLGNWNAFLWPVIVIESSATRTLPVGLSLFSGGEAGSEWQLIMAAASLAVIPVLMVFAFFQRQIVQGIALTGMKS